MVQIPDLYELPDGHPPSPYNSPLSIVWVGDGVLPEGLTVRAIGWIERAEFPTGSVPVEVIHELVNATPQNLFSDGSRGIHSCQLCGKTHPKIRWKGKFIALSGHGHYLIQRGRVVYMAPSLLLHYIRAHQYCPPQEFWDAVLKGRFLTEEDLVITWQEWET